MQVQQSRLIEGEERRLRATLRQLESRRSTVERAGLLHLAVMGEGGVGGVMQGLRVLEGHASAILDQEEAHASLSLGGKLARLCIDVVLPLAKCLWLLRMVAVAGGCSGVGVGWNNVDRVNLPKLLSVILHPISNLA